MKNLYLLKIGSRWLDASINKSNTLTWAPSFTVNQKLFGKKSFTYFYPFYRNTFFSPSVNSVAEVMITGTNWAIFFCMSCQKILSWGYCPAIILILTGFCKVWESLLPPVHKFLLQIQNEEVIFQMWERAPFGAVSTTSKEWHQDIGHAMWHLKYGSLSG